MCLLDTLEMLSGMVILIVRRAPKAVLVFFSELVRNFKERKFSLPD